MSEDVKQVMQEFGQAFEEFKKANDEKLVNLEKGISDGMLDSKIEKLEEKLNSLEDVKAAIDSTKAQQEGVAEKVEHLETVLTRPESGFDSKSVDTTCKAFELYCRKGIEKLSDAEKKALTVSNDTTGGYLAPPEYIRELLKTVTEISPIRQIAKIRSTGQRSIQVPKRTGQFAAQWVAESGTRAETTGYQVGLEEIPAHEHYALVDISEQDLEDTVFDLEAEMQSEFAEQFAKAEGESFITGNGTNKPTGLMNGTTVGHTATGAASAAITTDNLMDLVHGLKSEYARSATFMLNRTTLGIIRKLKDTAGQYIFQTGFSGQSGLPNTILGHPYVEAADVADAASGARSVIFGDFRRGYMIVDRVALSVLRDPFSQAATGNVRYIARRRVGGEVVLAEALTSLKHATS